MAKLEFLELMNNPQVSLAHGFVTAKYAERLHQARAGIPLVDMPEGLTFAAVEEMIKRKLVHTLNVVAIMYEIAPEEDLIPGIIAALLHDLERATQAFYGAFSDAETGFDHAKEAANILRALQGYFSIIDRFDEIITAVDEHSCANPLHRHEVLVRLLRDVDKVWILEEVIDNVNGDLDVGEGDLLTISNAALNAFLEKRLMRHHERAKNSVLDLLLFRLSWMYDIDSPKAKQSLLEKQTFERLFGKMVEIPPDEPRLQTVQEQLEAWIQETRKHVYA